MTDISGKATEIDLGESFGDVVVNANGVGRNRRGRNHSGHLSFIIHRFTDSRLLGKVFLTPHIFPFV